MNLYTKLIMVFAITMWLFSFTFCSGQSEQGSGKANGNSGGSTSQTDISEPSSILELIDRTKEWPSKNPNPIPLIRASNTIRKLPKTEILRYLSEYSRKFAKTPEQNQNPYHMHALVESLFEPADPSERLEYPSSILTKYPVADDPHFPLLPRVLLKFADDIPWAMQPDYFSIPPLSDADFQWLQQYAVVRKEPLRPADNPLVVADNLMRDMEAADKYMIEPNASQISDMRTMYFQGNFADQAISMVSLWISPIPELPAHTFMWESYWEPPLNESKKLGLYWDETKQQYALKHETVPQNH